AASTSALVVLHRRWRWRLRNDRPAFCDPASALSPRLCPGADRGWQPLPLPSFHSREDTAVGESCAPGTSRHPVLLRSLLDQIAQPSLREVGVTFCGLLAPVAQNRSDVEQASAHVSKCGGRRVPQVVPTERRNSRTPKGATKRDSQVGWFPG